MRQCRCGGREDVLGWDRARERVGSTKILVCINRFNSASVNLSVMSILYVLDVL